MGLLLNAAIGMSAIFLLVSLFVTTIQELLAQIFALRARYLRVGVVKLLEQGKSDIGIIGTLKGNTPLADAFYANPLIKALATSRIGRTAEPSYISKETFCSVALQITDFMTKGTTPEEILAAGKALKEKSSKSPLEHAIGTFAEEAGGNLKKIEARLATWFDEAMERVGGAYKRWTQIATIIIGIAFAGALNIDSIAISRSLLASPEQAALLADAAAKLSQATNIDSKLRDSLSVAMAQAKIPIGWKDSEPASNWFLLLIGWILTGLAASLGSAFWFDTLKRFVSIRASGRKPAEKGSSGS